MNIVDIDNFKEILYRILNIFHEFEVVLQDGDVNEEVRTFMMEKLCDVYENLEDLRIDVEKVNLPKKSFSNKQQLFSDEMIVFLYSNFNEFLQNK